LGNTSDGDTVNYASTIRNVIKKYGDAVYVIPGHGKWGGHELLSHTLELATRKP
jgi:metallo-beta-lactamase class B